MTDQKKTVTSGRPGALYAEKGLFTLRTLKGQAVMIFIIALALNINTLVNGWALDDTLLITQNDLTRQGVSALPEIWASDVSTGYFGKQVAEAGLRYRPLAQSIFAIQYTLFGPSPFASHLVNILLYALSCSLFLLFLAGLFPPSGKPGGIITNIPFLAGLFFAIHPLHAEVVANIKSLDEILALLLSLTASMFATGMLMGSHRLRWFLAGIAFFLALASKENAVTFLAVVPLVLWYMGVKPGKMIWPVMPLLLAALAYFLLRTAALDPDPGLVQKDNLLTDPFYGADEAGRIATVMLTWLKYLGLMIFPHPLTTDYYYAMIPITGWDDARVWLSIAVFAGAAAYALMTMKKKGPAGFGIVFFFITFSVTSNLLFNLGSPMNDRFVFMPLAGFCLMLASLVRKIPEKLSGRYSMILASGIIIIICMTWAVKTFSRNMQWKDDFTLFRHDIEVSAASARCNVMTGKAYHEAAGETADPTLKSGYVEKAKYYLKRGLEIYDRYPLAWGLLGVIEMQQQHYRHSAELFIECLEVEPTVAVALGNLDFLGRKMEEAGDHEGALLAMKALNHFDPRAEAPFLFFADHFRNAGRPDSAIITLDQLLGLYPEHVKALSKKADILINELKQPAIAEQYYLKALQLDPGNASLLNKLGVCASRQQDHQRSLQYFLKALEQKPDDFRLLFNIAGEYGILGDSEKSSEYSKRARTAENSSRTN